MASLAESIAWRDRLQEEFGWMPFGLAVQDGMDPDAVREELATGRWAALCVGGSKMFKYDTMWLWREVANEFGLWLHGLGLGSPEDQAWARARRCNSIDYTGWARHDEIEEKIGEGRALRAHQTRTSEFGLLVRSQLATLWLRRSFQTQGNRTTGICPCGDHPHEDGFCTVCTVPAKYPTPEYPTMARFCFAPVEDDDE